MSSETGPDAELIQRIAQKYLDGTVERVVDRSPGYSGSYVYAVDVVAPSGSVSCIIKLIPEGSDDEEVTNRVYGSRAASFLAAYTLLQQAAIPLPQLHAAFVPQPELPFYGYVMERLPGDNVQTVRSRLAGPSRTHLDALLGHYLGGIHRITRSYDGWADWQSPPSLPWRDVFFSALNATLERACTHMEISRHRRQLMQTFNHYAATWSDPFRFVLSHGDGLQGMLVQTDNGWELSGVIDIEDHRFTDQRFALAVYELSMGEESLHDSFWKAYLRQTALDTTYPGFRPLFQLYVLLDWLGSIPLTQPDEAASLTHKVALCCRVNEW